MVKNFLEKWVFWAWFTSLLKSLLKVLSFIDGDFGGVFMKLSLNAKIDSNSPFSGGNQLPPKADFVVVDISIPLFLSFSHLCPLDS